MPILVDAYLSVDGTDLSSFLQQVDIPLGRESHDDSAMGQDTRIFEAGVKTVGLTATLRQDDDLDAILDAIFEAGAAVPVILGSVGNVSPKRTGDMILDSYDPGFGAFGAKRLAKISMKPAGSFVRS